jgi:hypothetical protein
MELYSADIEMLMSGWNTMYLWNDGFRIRTLLDPPSPMPLDLQMVQFEDRQGDCV